MSENLKYFNLLKDTPKDAQKQIEGGRLKGFTDISPMWRIQKLTEIFGPCGLGWKYEIADKQIIPVETQIAVFVSVNLYVKFDGAWSEPIPGEGGDMIAAKERNGLHINDDAIKAALTDALGNACQRLGMSADIYSKKYGTKYDRNPQKDEFQEKQEIEVEINNLVVKIAKRDGTAEKDVKIQACNACRTRGDSIEGLCAIRDYLRTQV